VGLGGRDITPEVIEGVIDRTLKADKPESDIIWTGAKI